MKPTNSRDMTHDELEDMAYGMAEEWGTPFHPAIGIMKPWIHPRYLTWNPKNGEEDQCPLG